MDPTATYRLWLAALADNDKAAAIDHADDLLDWLARGGHDPQGWTAKQAADFHYWAGAHGLLVGQQRQVPR